MADKGIRPEALRKFLQDLPSRENTRLGNRNFRAGVITHLMEQFKIPLHSAATAYNNAFIAAREMAAGNVEKKIEPNAELAAQLVGLGRPEDKKGGRKKKAVAPAATPGTPEVGGAASDVLSSNILGSGEDEGDGDETPPTAKVKVIQRNGKAGPWEFDDEAAAQEFLGENTGKVGQPKMFIEGKE